MNPAQLALALWSTASSLTGKLMGAENQRFMADQYRRAGRIAGQRAGLDARATIAAGMSERAAIQREANIATSDARMRALMSGRDAGTGSTALAFDQSEADVDRFLGGQATNYRYAANAQRLRGADSQVYYSTAALGAEQAASLGEGAAWIDFVADLRAAGII